MPITASCLLLQCSFFQYYTGFPTAPPTPATVLFLHLLLFLPPLRHGPWSTIRNTWCYTRGHKALSTTPVIIPGNRKHHLQHLLVYQGSWSTVHNTCSEPEAMNPVHNTCYTTTGHSLQHRPHHLLYHLYHTALPTPLTVLRCVSQIELSAAVGGGWDIYW